MNKEQNIIIANWKMNGNLSSINQLTKGLASFEKNYNINSKVIICPPVIYLSLAFDNLKESSILLGSQDISSFDLGSNTGDISGLMLKDFSCKYVIIGHSERRINHNENGNILKLKINQAIKNNLTVIYCIGEQKEERESGNLKPVLEEQISIVLPFLEDIDELIIAYEPVWAIGTGKIPSLEEIKDVISLIKSFFSGKIKSEFEKKIKIIYGGSVNEENFKNILSIKDISGLLVGNASLNLEKFVNIITQG